MDYVRPTASLLASVTGESEALLCAGLGADVIDAKNPAEGALGALPLATIRAIRGAVPAHVPVSATIGDPVGDVEETARAVLRTAETGADFVKVGLSMAADAPRTLARLRRLDLGASRLVGVLLADEGLELSLVSQARLSGFAGLMLDTADKARGALPDVAPPSKLRSFIGAVHAAGMFAGLAGSLRADHVPELLALGPDILGFRGGLCRMGARTEAIDADAVGMLRRIIPTGAGAVTNACEPARRGAIAPRQAEGVA
jgi:uncharacterized protein (UPF0264 family)